MIVVHCATRKEGAWTKTSCGGDYNVGSCGNGSNGYVLACHVSVAGRGWNFLAVCFTRKLRTETSCGKGYKNVSNTIYFRISVRAVYITSSGDCFF